MIDRRTSTPAAEQLAVGNATIDKYNRRLLLLAAATGVVLIVLMFVTLMKVISIAEDGADNSREAAEQTRVIKTLVEAQDRNDANRQQLIDDAVAQIAAEQYRALVAHDHRTEAALNRALGLLDREVNAPANKEQPVVVIPSPFVGPRAPAPAPAPRAQVAPKPPPCEKAGKSGRCKKK